MKIVIALSLLLSVACPGPTPTPPGPTSTPGTTVTVTTQNGPTAVYVSFGSDSAITQKDWSSFCSGENLNCGFGLSNGSRILPNPDGKYLNATFSFGGPVGCGITKAEINVNNPNWYDTYDVSLVDGYSNKIQINYTPPIDTDGQPATVVLGPPAGEANNEGVLGVFPYGCDICVARQNPPCGIATGSDGCKFGTQYHPDVVCQYQGSVKTGGGAIEIVLVP